MGKIKDLQELIYDYKQYKALAAAMGGNNTSHAQYEHLQSVMKMCDEKLVELNTGLEEMMTCQDQQENHTL